MAFFIAGYTSSPKKKKKKVVNKDASIHLINTNQVNNSTPDNMYQIPLFATFDYNFILKSDGLNNDISFVGKGSDLESISLITFDKGGPEQIIEFHPNTPTGLRGFGYYGGETKSPNLLYTEDKDKHIDVLQHGALEQPWTNSGSVGPYRDCTNLVAISATDEMSRGAILKDFIKGCYNLKAIANPAGIIGKDHNGNGLVKFAQHAHGYEGELEGLDPFRYTGDDFRYSMAFAFDGLRQFTGSVKGLVNKKVDNISYMCYGWEINNFTIENWDTQNAWSWKNCFRKNYAFKGNGLETLSIKSLTNAWHCLQDCPISNINFSLMLISFYKQLNHLDNASFANTKGGHKYNTFHIGKAKRPSSGTVAEAYTHMVQEQFWSFKPDVDAEQYMDSFFEFTIDSNISGSTNNLSFRLPIFNTEEYNIKITVDSVESTWIGRGDSFHSKNLVFSTPGIKTIRIESLGDPINDELIFNFTKCSEDIKKLKSINNFGNLVTKGNKPFSGAENLETPNIDSWPVLKQKSARNTYWNNTNVTFNKIDEETKHHGLHVSKLYEFNRENE